MTQTADRALLAQCLHAIATGSPTAVRCTTQTSKRIVEPTLAKRSADTAENSREFGEWFAPFNADFGVEASNEGNPILETQQLVAFRMMDDVSEDEANDLAAIIAMRTAFGYWRPLVSNIEILAGKLERNDIVAVAQKCHKVLDEADAAAVEYISGS